MTCRRTASAPGRPSPPGPRARSGWSRASPTLISRAALTPVGTAYSDCSFYYGPSLAEAPWMLRLVQIGSYRLAFQCEILPIDNVKFWRH